MHFALQQREQREQMTADKITENALVILEKMKLIKREPVFPDVG